MTAAGPGTAAAHEPSADEATSAGAVTEGPATLIVNPSAGQERFVRRGQPTWRLLRVIDLLSERFDLDWHLTDGPGAATDLARTAADAGARAVFALGGDGTVRECAQGIVGRSAALGILPGGTTNVLAPSLGLPRDAMEGALQFVRAARGGKLRVRPLDIGMCGEHPFLMMMSRGIDGRALSRVSAQHKRRFGRAAVAWSGLSELMRGSEPPFRVAWTDEHGQEGTIEASYLAVCNVPHYAGRFRMAPGASPYDRKLDVVALSRRGRWATLRFAGGLARGRAASVPGVVTHRVREVAVEDLDHGGTPGLLQVDGDPIHAPGPTRIRIAPERLLVVMPGPVPGNVDAATGSG